MQGAAGVFGSAILEVAIGIIFLYFMLSVICSSIAEVIASSLHWRARDLEKALKKLVDNEALYQAVAGHPLIQAMGHNETSPPSYIPAGTFALALLDAVHNSGPAGATIPDRLGTSVSQLRAKAEQLAKSDQDKLGRVLLALIEDSRDPNALADRVTRLKQSIDQLPAEPSAAVTAGQLALAPLNTLEEIKAVLPHALGWDQARLDAAVRLVDIAEQEVTDAAYNADKLRHNVETWFDNSMDRMSGTYKRHIQAVLFAVGLLLSVATGADTLRFVGTLYANPTLRAELATTASSTPVSPTLKETADQLASFSLLFGYADLPRARTTEVLFWVEKVAGLLATTFAITMGAPFWFQLLQKVVNLRGAGPKPISQSQSMEAVKQQKVAAKT